MSLGYVNFYATVEIHIKDVRANCFCPSLLRTQIQMPRHASSVRAKY